MRPRRTATCGASLFIRGTFCKFAFRISLACFSCAENEDFHLVVLRSFSSTRRRLPWTSAPKMLFEKNVPDAETLGKASHFALETRLSLLGVTVNGWLAKFSNVGDKLSCPTEPLSEAQEAARVRRVPMIFERPLKSVPMVFVSITELSTESTTRLKYQAKAINITKEGFTLEFKVFCDTFVEDAEVNWMAI